MTKREALAAVPMFGGLRGEVLDEILSLCVERTLVRGETLFTEGDRSMGLLVIWRGLLKVYKLGEGGREQILEIEGPGRSVAELPLFDGMPYPAYCAALEDSVVLILAPSRFERLVAREPDLARAVISGLARRLRHMVSLVEEISLKAVRERLVDLLLEMAGEAETIELTLTNQEIAARIGTVREIVSRTLSRLAHEGAIHLDGRTLTLLDRTRL
jgi:CRP/FNR family transcriptional regulator